MDKIHVIGGLAKLKKILCKYTRLDNQSLSHNQFMKIKLKYCILLTKIKKFDNRFNPHPAFS